jgi:hypothetical protein
LAGEVPMDPKMRPERGPFTADMIRDGDRYELDRGHALYVAPGGGEHGRNAGLGFAVLSSDPLVDQAGVDVGYVLDPGTMRAPDVAVGNVPDRPGWVKGAPPLALEYASTGQDDEELATRIPQLLKAGTRWVWVVRLQIPRHVVVYEAGQPERAVFPGETLEAPGILALPVPVEALWDGRLAADVTFRNLLSRRGYTTLEQLREEVLREGRELGLEEGRELGLEKGRELGLEKGRELGLEEGRKLGIEQGAASELRAAIRQILEARFGPAAAEAAAARLDVASLPVLRSWLATSLRAPNVESALS